MAAHTLDRLLKMKLRHLVQLLLVLEISSAFYINPQEAHRLRSVGVRSTLDDTVSPSMDKDVITAEPRKKLLDVAYGLQDEFGVFIIDKDSQEELRKAAGDLEDVAEKPSFDEETKKVMLGDWTLVCTTTTTKSLPFGGSLPLKNLPFINEGPLKDIRQALNRCLTVQQTIQAKDSTEVNRVDHVIEYKPPKTLQDILDSLPSFNINPLDVTKGKFVLIHEADVSNSGPGFSIRLKLASVVLNVAGSSQYLDPDGEDVLGINSPLKEFQAGTFETTYLDDTLRISRTAMGPVDQLRVYVRSEKEEMPEDYLDEEYFDEFDSFGQEDDDEDDGVVDADIMEDDGSPSDY